MPHSGLAWLPSEQTAHPRFMTSKSLQLDLPPKKKIREKVGKASKVTRHPEYADGKTFSLFHFFTCYGLKKLKVEKFIPSFPNGDRHNREISTVSTSASFEFSLHIKRDMARPQLYIFKFPVIAIASCPPGAIS
jgi:hypothetical protein